MGVPPWVDFLGARCPINPPMISGVDCCLIFTSTGSFFADISASEESSRRDLPCSSDRQDAEQSSIAGNILNSSSVYSYVHPQAQT